MFHVKHRIARCRLEEIGGKTRHDPLRGQVIEGQDHLALCLALSALLPLLIWPVAQYLFVRKQRGVR